MTTNKWYFSQEQSVTGITKTELPDSEVVASSLATFTVPATGHHTQQPPTTGMIYFVICSNWHLISAPTFSKFVTHFTLQPDAKMLRHSHEKTTFHKRVGHKHKIMDGPFKPKYGTVSHWSTFATGCSLRSWRDGRDVGSFLAA